VGLFSAVSLIPEQQRDRRVEAGSWSAAEVLEHLHRVESGIARLLARSVERAKETGWEPEDEVGSVLGSLDELHLTERAKRVPAPDPVKPSGELGATQGIAALQESRRALVAALESADGLALGRIMHAHPLIGPLNLYQWVLFVGQHEARHAGQLRDIAGHFVT
jgi:uncharacterized damage-inducible protein DinB